jgi:hypothetical protein
MTLSITTFSITTISVMTLNIIATLNVNYNQPNSVENLFLFLKLSFRLSFFNLFIALIEFDGRSRLTLFPPNLESEKACLDVSA